MLRSHKKWMYVMSCVYTCHLNCSLFSCITYHTMIPHSPLLTLSTLLTIYRYTRINSAAMKLLKPGGLLLTCSCSSVVAQEPHCFSQIIREAGKDAFKSVTVLSTISAGMDHPLHVGYSDGKHLSVVLARVN